MLGKISQVPKAVALYTFSDKNSQGYTFLSKILQGYNKPCTQSGTLFSHKSTYNKTNHRKDEARDTIISKLTETSHLLTNIETSINTTQA